MLKYQVSHIYIQNQKSMIVYKSDEISPKELRNNNALGTYFYIAIKLNELVDGQYKYYGCDYSHMITDQKQMITDTWGEFNKLLTDGLVLGYETKTMPGYIPGSDKPSNSVTTWDVMSTTNTFDVNYANKDNGLEDIFALRWTMPDLVISIQEEADEYPNLDNCLPVINGLMCRPIYRDNTKKLYAQEGAHLAWQEDYHRTPEVQLIDFTNIGTTEICIIRIPEGNVSYKDTLSFCNKNNTISFLCDWRIITSKSLYQYTPIIVIAGIPIFPDQYEIVSEHELIFSPYVVPWNYALQMQEYFTDNTYNESELFFRTNDPLEYIKDHTDPNRSEVSPSMFILYINHPRVLINRLPVDVWDNNVIMNLYAKEGLLLHNTTGRIITYHREEMTDRKELTIQNLSGYLSGDKKFEEIQYGGLPGDRYTRENLRNLMKGDCTIIHLMR